MPATESRKGQCCTQKAFAKLGFGPNINVREQILETMRGIPLGLCWRLPIAPIQMHQNAMYPLADSGIQIHGLGAEDNTACRINHGYLYWGLAGYQANVFR